MCVCVRACKSFLVLVCEIVVSKEMYCQGEILGWLEFTTHESILDPTQKGILDRWVRDALPGKECLQIANQLYPMTDVQV